MQKIILKKKLTKFTADEVLVRKGWFVSLQNVAQKFEKNPTIENKAMLLGYITSAKFIVENL